MRNNFCTDLEMEMVLFFYLTNRYSINSIEKSKLNNLAKRINYVSGNNRTLDSIYMRLQNYKYIDPLYKGKGLSGGANLCQEYWDKYVNNISLLEKKYNSFMKISNQGFANQIIPETSEVKKWTNLEMKICLYLYLNYDLNDLNKDSNFLNSVINKMNLITNNNRTIDSILMRLQNYKYIDPSSNAGGLPGGANQCQDYWNKYIDNQFELKKTFEELIYSISDSDKNEFEDNITKIISEIDDDDLIDKDAYIESIINVRNPSFQRHFKDGLIIEFGGKCAMCGLDVPELLVASHILPYSMCNNKKSMINSNNGLLLCAIHDALFDKKIISFDISGRIIISKEIDEKIWDLLGINDDFFLEQKYFNPERRKFIDIHRSLFEKKEKQSSDGGKNEEKKV